MFWILTSGLDSGKCFGFWDVFFNSDKWFAWIPASVMDSGKCFVSMSHGTVSLRL